MCNNSRFAKNYTKQLGGIMEKVFEKVLRIEATVYVELEDGETQEEAEDRFLCALPDGMTCASYKAQLQNK